MTQQQAKELLPVLSAYAEGKVVQWRIKPEGAAHPGPEWVDYDAGSHYRPGLELQEWRVKPSPREWWLCPSCLHGYTAYIEREHLDAFQCSKCSVNVVRVREVVP